MNLKSMIERLTVLEGEQKHEDPATQAWFDGYNAAKAKDKSNNTHPKGSEESRAYDEGYNDGVQELKGRFDAVNEQDVAEGSEQKWTVTYWVEPKSHDDSPSKEYEDKMTVSASSAEEAVAKAKSQTKRAYNFKAIPAKKDVTEGSGSSLERILAAHPEAVENFKQGGDLDYDLESDLWDYYFNNGEIRNYDADASEFISQRLADELGLNEGLDANQKRVGQLGPTEKVKNNNIGKLVGANESLEIAAKPQGLRSWMKSVEQEIIAEAALDPSQIAIPSIKPSGSATTTTVKTPQTSSTSPASSSMGASVIDFKDPNDPLKAALQKAIQNKSVTALGEDDLDEVISKSTPVADIIADFIHSKDSRFANKSKQERTKMALGAYYGMHPELSKKEESVMESKQAVMESTLDEVISRYPHEHKACQEGWGMDEHLYEALCDHYFKEGRIPYKIWHGPLEELRQCVEECYMQDTNPQPVVDEGLLGGALGALGGAALAGPLGAIGGYAAGSKLGDDLDEDPEVDEGLLGGALGAAAGAALTKTPSGAVTGAHIGSELQNALTDDYEDELDEASMANQFMIGDTVYHRNQPAKVYDMRGDTVIVTLANGDRDVWPASEVSLTRQGFLPTMKQDVKDIGRGLKGFLTGKNELGEEMMPEDLSQYTEEMEENMNESEEKWIQKAIKHPGALKKQLGVPADEKIPAGKLNAASKKGGKLGQRARLAKTLSKMDESNDRDEWDSNMPGYRGDYGGAQNWNRREREDDERHDLDVFHYVLVVDGVAQDQRFDDRGEAMAAGQALLKQNPGSKVALRTVRGVMEGRMVKGPGGVALDRQGNPKMAKPAMPKLSRMTKPKLDLDKIWFDVTQIIGNIFPDGDPADYLPSYCRKHGCTYDDIRAAAKKNGYKDEYDYIDDLKSGDYGYTESLAEAETKDTGKGRIHKGDYGTKDSDEKAAKPKGRGRPKKDADSDTGEVNKPDWSAFGVPKKDIKLPKWKGSTTKHKIKDESKDAQMESWDRELNNLLTEGLTVSTSTGQQGMPDSVSVSATDADAHNLLQIIQRAGLTGGATSAGAASDDTAGVISVEPVSSDEVMSNLAPEQEDDGEEAFGFLKKMLGARQTASSGYSAYKPAAGCDECGSDECECDKEEEVEEGNAFTGALAKAKADGIQPGEKIKVGGKEYPVKEEEESVEEGEWQGTGETDMAAAVAQNGDAEEDAETEKETAMAESEETCNECGGIMEEDHKCATQELNEWANSRVGGDEEQFQTEMDFMLNLISGGLNGKKTQHKHGYRFGDNPMSTPMEQDLDINSIKRLSGIK